MPVCDLCKAKGITRNLSTQRELDIHKKYFHRIAHNGQHQARQVAGVMAGGSCPDCGSSSLTYSEGCVKCLNCFWTKCV